MKVDIQKKTSILRKAIFPILFLFLFVGDWHLHTEFTHPCEEEHASTHSDAKWHPHEACNDSEQDVQHDDLNNVLLDTKTFAGIPQTFISIDEAPLVHVEHFCHHCSFNLSSNILSPHLESTFLLI